VRARARARALSARIRSCDSARSMQRDALRRSAMRPAVQPSLGPLLCPSVIFRNDAIGPTGHSAIALHSYAPHPSDINAATVAETACDCCRDNCSSSSSVAVDFGLRFEIRSVGVIRFRGERRRLFLRLRQLQKYQRSSRRVSSRVDLRMRDDRY
jgi:hypothetical protein